MLDIHSMICAQRVMVLKKYTDEENNSGLFPVWGRGYVHHPL